MAIGVVDSHRVDDSVLHVEGDHQGIVEAPRLVVEDFPAAVVFEARPGGDRPDIVELPIEDAHAAVAEAAPVLDGRLDCHGLLDLREPQRFAKALGHAEVSGHRLNYEGIAAGVALVVLEGRARDVELSRGREAPRRSEGGQGLKAEFRAEAGPDLEIGREGLAFVPDAPIVHVAAAVRVPVVAEVARARRGRGGPEGAARIELADHAAHGALVETIVVDDIARGILLRLLVPGYGAEGLVVAAPEGDGRVVAEPPHLVAEFPLHEVEEGGVGGIEGAGEHRVLPDEETEFVAKVVELIGLVAAASPDPEHVHVGGLGRVEEVGHALALPARGQGVGGNPVGALGEDLASVDAEDERTADGVVDGQHFEAAKADSLAEFVGPACLRARGPDHELVEGLLPIAGGPPALDPVEFEGEAGSAFARRTVDENLSLVTIDFRGDGGPARGLGAKVDMDIEAPSTAPEILGFGRHIFDARALERHECYAIVDAARHEAGAPIPAGHALGLADEVAVGGGAGVGGPGNRIGQGRRLLQRRFFRRSDEDLNAVAAFFQGRSGVEPEAKEHAFARTEEGAVEADLADRVENTDIEEDVGAAGRFRVDREITGQNPVFAANPLGGQFVSVDEGIGQLARSDEGRHDVAGDGDGPARLVARANEGPGPPEFDS